MELSREIDYTPKKSKISPTFLEFYKTVGLEPEIDEDGFYHGVIKPVTIPTKALQISEFQIQFISVTTPQDPNQFAPILNPISANGNKY